MKCLSVISFYFLLCFYVIQRVSSENALTPPRGWNSYDSFSWIISEEEYLENANIISQRLLVHGYEYAVVDYLWYRSLKGTNNSFGFDMIDEWGRMLPDPERWPSSRGGKGFIEVANKVHSMGLKFGIHLMAGISTQAFNNNTPILDTTTGQAYMESGRVWHAKDIGIQSRACKWMTDGFMGINATTGAGKAFLRSIYELYASWGIDFVKLDCVFGDDLDLNEIISVSKILNDFNHSIVFSLSPGVSATPQMAEAVSSLVNMYRVTGDDWDEWSAVLAHFNVSRDFADSNLIGVEGLKGKCWPDLDMLPFGWLTDAAVNEGPHRFSNLNQDEQRTQMTLWCMAKSPIMYGGDLRKIDAWTYDLITNPALLEINAFSSNNFEFPYIAISNGAEIEGQNFTKVPFTRFLVTGCTDPKASGWYSEKYNQGLERICYKKDTQKDQEEPFCLHKRELTRASSNEKSMYRGKLHLADINNNEFCLDAYPKRTLTNKGVKKESSFSPCRFKASQIWELKSKTLVNGNSGTCAAVEFAQVEAFPNGIRSWIASGRKGEIYVAYFNLNDENTAISSNIVDLGNVLPGKRTLKGCSGTEMWSGKTIQTNQSLSAQVPRHGSALFVLNCTLI
ncbi:uncharacterized protein LOC113874509 [Abrus precatorius]|uniref:Alpha-galactosidase n=1 Tax=Abrus precatorius TaxID=3816 RepID=A0A8B8MLP7_ABRPR|nr:uncharacterized protein LOC113874509 [Abrus precatorius]